MDGSRNTVDVHSRVIPGWNGGRRRVPTRRDVGVRPVEHYQALPIVVEGAPLRIRARHVAEQRAMATARTIENKRKARGDRLLAGNRDERSKAVGIDELVERRGVR